MTAADIIVRYLESHGVEYVFGIPGGAIVPLNNALHKSSIEVIVTKHEEGAAFMADGYARVSGNIGICCSTAGPGATNLLTGVASANADSVPVIALTGQVATNVFGKGAVQEFATESFGIVNIFKQVTKYSDIIINPKKTFDMISKARRVAVSGRRGAVHLNMPSDVMNCEVPGDDDRCFVPQMMSFDREGVKAAVKLLLEAKRPVILAGWGTVVSRADAELLEFAELLDIPVATSPKAKGILSEVHPLSLGVLGFAGSMAAKDYIIKNDIDVMLAVGTSFNEWVTSGWDKGLLPVKAMVQVDIDPDEIGKNYYVNVGVSGDAKTVLREMIYEVRRNSETKDRVFCRGTKEVENIKRSLAKTVSYTEPGQGNLYKPQDVLDNLSKSLPSDTIYFADNGSSMAWAINRLTITKPYSFYVGLGFASMGYAVNAPIGAKLAAGDRPVVALVGDGSFLMNGMEVATAVNYNIPVIWVIMNNSMLGMVHHGMKLVSSSEGMASKFATVDFAKLAESLGARGIRISEPGEITEALISDIIASGRPTVLDVIIDPEEVPPIHSRTATLRRNL